jgi:hypothetical protein
MLDFMKIGDSDSEFDPDHGVNLHTSYEVCSTTTRSSNCLLLPFLAACWTPLIILTSNPTYLQSQLNSVRQQFPHSQKFPNPALKPLQWYEQLLAQLLNTPQDYKDRKLDRLYRRPSDLVETIDQRRPVNMIKLVLDMESYQQVRTQSISTIRSSP